MSVRNPFSRSKCRMIKRDKHYGLHIQASIHVYIVPHKHTKIHDKDIASWKVFFFSILFHVWICFYGYVDGSVCMCVFVCIHMYIHILGQVNLRCLSVDDMNIVVFCFVLLSQSLIGLELDN